MGFLKQLSKGRPGSVEHAGPARPAPIAAARGAAADPAARQQTQALAQQTPGDVALAPGKVAPTYGQTRSLTQMADVLIASLSAEELKHAYLKKTTLYRLIESLWDLEGAQHPSQHGPILAAIRKGATHYQSKHRGSKDPGVRSRTGMMSDIEQLAEVQQIRAAAELEYVRGVTESAAGPAPAGPVAAPKRGGLDRLLGRKKQAAAPGPAARFHHLQQAGGSVMAGTWAAAPSAAELAGAKPTEIEMEYGSGKQRQAALGARLSQAETMAIYAYTAQNYKHMNAAVSGWDQGLDHELGAAATPQSRQEIRLEGTAHAALALQGMTKLPAWNGTTFRGENLDLARMKKLYSLGATAANVAFMSTSKNLATAKSFAAGAAGPVRVILELEMAGTGARDLSTLSAVRSEAEIMLLPGARYTTVSIDSYDAKNDKRTPLRGQPDDRAVDGKPPTYWVRIRQVG